MPQVPDALPPIIGYVTPLRGAAGATLDFKFSSRGNAPFTAQVLRIDCADPNPAGPGMKLVPVAWPLPPQFDGLEQTAYSGSCAWGRLPALTPVYDSAFPGPGKSPNNASAHSATAPLVNAPFTTRFPTLAIDLRVRPLMDVARAQTVIALQNADGTSGLAAVWINGAIEVRCWRDGVHAPDSVDAGARVAAEHEGQALRLPLDRWTALSIRIDAHGLCRVSAREAGIRAVPRHVETHYALAPEDALVAADTSSAADAPTSFMQQLAATLTHVTIAGCWRGHPAATFDGMIEAPAVAFHGGSIDDDVAVMTPLAAWDFTPTLDLTTVPDALDPSRQLVLVNMPTRMVRGSNWSGHHQDWKIAPDEYGAIHFHSDDLMDCQWETSVSLQIPDTLPSGVYGLAVDNGTGKDIVPFFVTPRIGRPGARIAYLASTLTYVAYANHARNNFDDALQERVRDWNAYPHNPDVVTAYGKSTYNRHPDGSGIAISSRLRPILSMRPGYLTFDDPRGSGLRHFPADSHLTDWLTEKGLPFDVITDEDLDDFGMGAIAPYSVVVTGSHPEYHTRRMLDALLDYQEAGGKLMYLGGNGFYWKIARPAAVPHAIEIRRAEGGIRAWSAEPGEYYHQFDGEYGGLWRRNGVAPQRVAGVGFAVQGLFEGSYYERTPESHDPAVAWLFDGVDAFDESGSDSGSGTRSDSGSAPGSTPANGRIGDFGLSGGGAAGFELDQAASDLGTPDGVTIVAVSRGHGPSFQTVPEEILTWTLAAGLPRQYAGVAAHMVYGENAYGGALFAVGSITFLGSLSHNGYRNTVSCILENCLRRFSGISKPPI